MNLTEKLTQQLADEEIKVKDTIQDWFDTLEEEEFEELERLITIQEEDPENEECEKLGELVMLLYAIEADTIKEDGDQIITEDIGEEEFFKVLNSFLFLLPFYYWMKQGLIKVNTKISLLENKENKITVTLTEYGK